MSHPSGPWLIVGQGLAGTCLAWELWWRKIPFRIIDDERGGSSRIAAGLINPVTGKNFEPSKGITEALPEAIGFYQKTALTLAQTHWHPLPILRLADSENEWQKIQSKLARPDVAPWISPATTPIPAGWHAAVSLHGGGRLDTRGFLDASRTFFQNHDLFHTASWSPDSSRHAPHHTILCDGASGILTGRTGPHRCAKGEILTLHTTTPVDHIRIGAGGWLVPVGNDTIKVGSTYEWDQLDHEPSETGRSILLAKAARLLAADFEIINHEAAIRPILRRSEPLIGPIESGHWIFNGLGSKGSLHAPATARQLADWLIDDNPPAAELDIRNFLSAH